MADIHPGAIVDPGAELGDNVEIGSYSIIEKDVVIGDNTWIGPHVVIRSHTTIGCDNRVYQFSSIGEAPQSYAYAGEPTRLTVGDRNIIREYCTLNRGTAQHSGETRIKNDNLIMAGSHIAHDCVVENNAILANGATLGGHVNVGDFAILGGGSFVHQFSRIGVHCIVSGGTMCYQDITPYITAAGNPAKPFGINTRGLRRRNFSEQTIGLLKQAYRLLYRSNLDLRVAIEKIDMLDKDSAVLRELSAFLRHSARGISR